MKLVEIHTPGQHVGLSHPPSTESDISDESAAAMARAAVRLFDKWDLKDQQSIILLGELGARTWSRWKIGMIGRIDRDRKTRLSILMGIHKALRLLYTDASRGYRWIKSPNSAFGEQTPLSIMLQGSLFDLMRVRSYLDSVRG